jgi:hypothetical protein
VYTVERRRTEKWEGMVEKGRKVAADRKSVSWEVATVYLTGERVIADRETSVVETSVVGTSVVAALKNRGASSRIGNIYRAQAELSQTRV